MTSPLWADFLDFSNSQLLKQSEKLNEWPIAQSFLFMEIAKKDISSSQTQVALKNLASLNQTFSLDPEEFKNFFNLYEFQSAHPQTKSFIAFYRFLKNKEQGFHLWAKIQEKKIQTKSFWGDALLYYKALSLVKQGQLKKATDAFKTLWANSSYPEIKQQSGLQFARLLFESRKYKASSKIYAQLKIPSIRQRELVFLEEAWVHYYLKNYPKTLGLLTALKVGPYSPITPAEGFLLEAAVYKELCHYDRISGVHQSFKKSFEKSLWHIQSRKSLQKDQKLFGLAALDRDLQLLTDLVNQLQKEKKAYLSKKPLNGALHQKLLSFYQIKERNLKFRANLRLKERTRVIAENILQVDQELNLLRYLSKVAALDKPSNRTPAQKIKPQITFKKIRWPVSKEYWQDELNNYRVLIRNQCQG